jgi:hypothetical protein
MVDLGRAFVDRKVKPVVREMEYANAYPDHLIEQMQRLGIFGPQCDNSRRGDRPPRRRRYSQRPTAHTRRVRRTSTARGERLVVRGRHRGRACPGSAATSSNAWPGGRYGRSLGAGQHTSSVLAEFDGLPDRADPAPEPRVAAAGMAARREIDLGP